MNTGVEIGQVYSNQLMSFKVTGWFGDCWTGEWIKKTWNGEPVKLMHSLSRESLSEAGFVLNEVYVIIQILDNYGD